jgi:ferritin-like protein
VKACRRVSGLPEVYNKLAHKTHGKAPITYALIVHILGEEVEHETELETLLS